MPWGARVELGPGSPYRRKSPLRKRSLRRAAAAAAIATVGLVGFAGVAGANTPYTVKPGDTLSRIAPSNWREVAAGNGIRNPDLIYVGQVIDLSATAPAAGSTSWRGPSGATTAAATASSGRRARAPWR